MAKQPGRTSRWSTVLVEALLSLVAVLSPAAGRAAPVEASTPAAAGSSTAGPPSVRDAAENGTPLAAPDGNDLYLDVELNGTPHGLVPFAWRDGQLWARATTLLRLGFVFPPGTGDLLPLHSLPGLQASYDSLGQRLTLMVPLPLLQLPTTVLSAPGTVAQPATASPGMLLNYEISGTQAPRGSAGLSAFTELRVFSGTGVLGSTALTQTARGNDGDWQGRTTRLDTTWSSSFPDRMLTMRVGDTLTGSLPWTRATRIGGVQLSTNFSLQPYRTTAPLPAFLGSATLPSDVELYINGQRQYTGKVPAGPFQLSTVPNISGAGNAKVVLTDALGHATTLDFALYDTQQLLQKGLSDWTVELGAVRNGYGLRSFDYGHEPAASGTWRFGVSDKMTVETHVEATRRLAAAGLGGTLLLGQAGVVSGSAAGSAHGGRHGSQLSLGYNWRKDSFNVGVSATGTRGDYLDVAALHGTAPARGKGGAVVGYNTRDIGSFGLSYLYLHLPGQPAVPVAGASWFMSIGRSTSLSLSINQNLADRSERSIFFGFTMALGGNTTLNSGMQRDRNSLGLMLDVGSPAPSEGGAGWRSGLRQSDGQTGAMAEIDYLGRQGRVAAGVSVLGDSRYAYAAAGGALVLMGGRVFATRHIDDAFAVVSTDGIADVPVMVENRRIGHTDAQGMLLVAPLRAYQNNQLGIDSMQLPANVRIDRVKAVATPSDRAGTLVRFGITPVRAASILLVDEAGQPLALGSLVRLQGQPGGEPALVGFDGAVYLDTLDVHNVLIVQTPIGACRVSFDHHQQTDGVVQVGPLSCRQETP